jgi:TP901 family phage tail tape measure protein
MARTLGDAFVRVRPDMGSFPGELSRGVESSSKGLAGQGQTAGTSYATGMERGLGSRLGHFAKVAGVALGAAGLYGAAAFTKNAVGLEQAFGKTMNIFQANANATKAQMRDMSALALKMGKDTVFSANDAANAMLELAKNGMTPATIQAGALKEALTLAAAGGVGMEQAATVMGNALNAFGLKGKQASQVSAALAGAANASSASIQSLSYGLQAAATTAHDSGLSIQQTTGVLAAFENAGIKGSDAGTSLKTMLSRLVPQTTKAGDAMDALGLKFTDSHGQFVSITDIAGQLQDKLGGLSDKERTTALNTIFGSDARRAATILMNQGTKGIAKYIKATSDQGAADKQAAAAMKGTAGAIEQRKGSVETLGLAFGKAIKPITLFANRMGADIANKAVPIVQEAGQKLRKFIHDLGGMDAILARLNPGKVFHSIKDAIAGIDWHSTSKGASSVGSSFSKIGDAIGKADWGAVKDAFGKGLADTVSVFSVAIGFAADHLDEFAKLLPTLVVAFAAYKTAQAAANVAKLAELPITTAQVIANWRLGSSMKALTAQQAISNGTTQAGLLTRLRSTAATVAHTVAEKAAAVASKVWAAGQWLLNAALTANPIGIVVVALVALVAGLVVAYKKSDTFRKIVAGAWDHIKKAVASAWNGFIKPALEAFAGFITGKVIPVVTWLWTRVIKPYFRFIGAAIAVAWGVIKRVLQAWWAYITHVLIPIVKFLWDKVIKPAFESIGQKIDDTWNKVIKPVFGFLKRGVEGVRDTVKSAVDAIGRIWESLKEKAAGPVRFVVDTVYNNGIRRVVNSIPGVSDLPELKFAKGGPVPMWAGERGKDSVHALLMPGEHVWTDEEVKKVGGHGNMKRLREAIRRGWMGVADLSPLPRFADGGGVGFPDSRLSAARTFAIGQQGKPYLWGGVGPSGYDCSGFMSAITNVLRGYNPYSRVGATASFPWPGFTGGTGQFTIGSTPNYGGSGVGHMAGTLMGMNVESRGGTGVLVGAAARGYGDPGFSTIAHAGVAGSFGGGKVGGGGFLSKFADAIGAVKDFAKKVPGYFDQLASMGGWGGMMRQMVAGVLGGLRGWVNDKIPGPGPLPSFDRGGLAHGRGLMLKDITRPERVLSPRETDAFEQLVAQLGGRGRGGGRIDMKITNWDEGTGYLEFVAGHEYDGRAQLTHQRADAVRG